MMKTRNTIGFNEDTKVARLQAVSGREQTEQSNGMRESWRHPQIS
jgi:hypothetical protein